MKFTFRFWCCFLSLVVCLSCLVVPTFAQEDFLVASEITSSALYGCSACEAVNLEAESDGIVLTEVTANDILSRLSSTEAFSLEGSFVKGNQVISLDDYYDFSSMSRFAIAKWAFQYDLISEAQMIEGYCDLLAERIFENVGCLDPFYKEIKDYAASHRVSATLEEKISSTLTVNTNPLQSQNARNNEHLIVVDWIMVHDVNNVLSDAVLTSIGNFAASIKATFEGIGFDFPSSNVAAHYIIALTTSNDGDACHTESFESLTDTTCLSTTYIYGVDSNTTLNNELRQQIAHGMFHAIQNNYNKNVEDWFREACANWGAWAVTGLTTNLNLNSFISSTRCMTDDVGGGAMLFPATIDFFYGSVPTIVEIYEQLSTVDNTETAIDRALAARGYSDTFEDVFLTMAVELADPGSGYSDISGLQNNAVDYTNTYSFGNDFVEDNVEGYGRSYFSFAPASGVTNYTVEFEIILSGSGSGIVYQYWYNSENEFCIQECNVNANGTLTLTHPDSEEGNPSGEVGIIVVSTGSDFSFYIDYTVTQN